MQKLSVENQKLWQSFVEAMRYRGAKVHGDYTSPFDRDQQSKVKAHLQAFHDVARWIKVQMGQEWKLDVSEDDKPLDPFP